MKSEASPVLAPRTPTRNLAGGRISASYTLRQAAEHLAILLYPNWACLSRM